MSFESQPLEDRRDLLRDYLKETSEDGNLELARDELESAIAGVGDGELEVATGGMEGLQESLEVITNDEAEITSPKLDSLEAIVHKTGRPVIDVVYDSFDPPTGKWSVLGDGDAKKNIEAAIPSVGRIEVPNHPLRPYAGTGFVVGDGIVMTNRHVARIFSQGLGVRNLTFDPGMPAAIDFKREIPRRDAPAPILLEVSRVLMVHPYWDMALLKVDGLASDKRPCAYLSFPSKRCSTRRLWSWATPLETNGAIRRFKMKSSITSTTSNVWRREFCQGRSDFGDHQLVSALTHDSSTLGGTQDPQLSTSITDKLWGYILPVSISKEFRGPNDRLGPGQQSR